MARLAGGLSMIAPDLPGHGRSPPWDESLPYQDDAARLVAPLLEEAGGPADLIGHSFGGTLALRLAAIAPGRVGTLILIEPPFYPALEAGPPAALAALAAQAAKDRHFVAALQEGDREAAARHFHEVWGDGTDWEALDPVQRDYVAGRIHTIEGGGVPVNADRVGLMSGGLEKIGAPTLLVRGTESPPMISPALEVLAERIPDAAVQVIEGAGHMLPVSHASELARTIHTFLHPR